MSEIKVNSIKGVAASTAALTINNTDGTCTANITNNLSNRRININGGMAVWQRSTSKAVSDGTNEEVQACDRYGFKFGNSAAGGATVSRSTDVPTNLGFPYSFKIDVTTINNNSAANTQILFFHRLEAQDIANSGWKYNDSSSFLTISFYFKTNKSGTNKLPIQIETQDGTQYWYVSEITQSDTSWNRYTVKIPGNSNLTFNSDNGYGMEIAWYLTAGSTYHGTADTWGTTKIHGTSNSTNYMDSTSNDLFFTGIQVEATTDGIATDFEHRTFNQELLLCQRYFIQDFAPQIGTMYEAWSAPNGKFATFNFPVQMRAAPTVVTTNGVDGVVNSQFDNGSGGAVSVQKHASVSSAYFYNATTQFQLTGLTVGSPGAAFSAEL
jgi:hypothetical protein